MCIITEEGEKALRRSLQEERKDIQTSVKGIGEGFIQLDGKVKEICTAWQVKKVGGESYPSIHDDPVITAISAFWGTSVHAGDDGHSAQCRD